MMNSQKSLQMIKQFKQILILYWLKQEPNMKTMYEMFVYKQVLQQRLTIQLKQRNLVKKIKQSSVQHNK